MFTLINFLKQDLKQYSKVSLYCIFMIHEQSAYGSNKLSVFGTNFWPVS